MIQVGPDYLNSLIANLMIEDSTTDTSPKIEGLTIKSPFNWLQEKKFKSKLTHTYIFLNTKLLISIMRVKYFFIAI
jgi:hypothetical protein